MTTATDMDDPERLALGAWSRVYVAWLDGDPEPLAQWLRDPANVVTDDAREFLAALALGKVKRTRGNKRLRHPAEERAIVVAVFEARERLARHARPEEAAWDEVAAARSLTRGTIKGIAERARAAGLSFEAWQRWGRPRF